MPNETINQLQKAQEKLNAINTLSNCLQKATINQVKDIAYLIHKIIEAKYIDTTLAREITSWQI